MSKTRHRVVWSSKKCTNNINDSNDIVIIINLPLHLHFVFVIVAQPLVHIYWAIIIITYLRSLISLPRLVNDFHIEFLHIYTKDSIYHNCAKLNPDE